MSATTTAQIDARINERLERGFDLADAVRMSLSECPVSVSDVRDYAAAMGVEVPPTHRSRLQIIAAILG